MSSNESSPTSCGHSAEPPSETPTRLRRFHATGATRSVAFRVEQLKALRSALSRYEGRALEALRSDLGKPEKEAWVSEIGFVDSDIRHTLRHIEEWARPQRRRLPPVAWPGTAVVYPEPLGAVLIIGPWNYPLQLLLSPMVAAVAAGNCVCLKPSELAPATSRLVAEMVHDAFEPDYVTVLEGDGAVSERLVDAGFDHVFFTGSPATGRMVMEVAARHLTPVTLELGGKNPCIVCEDADIGVAARRIVWGKFLNAGQTCVAPDYVMVHESAKDPLLDAMRRTLAEFYGPDPRRSPDYGRIVNPLHFDRLMRYLDQGRVVAGGSHDRNELFLEPTVIAEPEPDTPVMQEEIFGPILPVRAFSSLDDVLVDLSRLPKPLALYLFARDPLVHRRVASETSSGGLCINDTITHILCKNLPFGGVGLSGMGACRGRAGFDAFTHAKSILRRATWLDLRFRYPPIRTSLATLRRAGGFLLRW